MHLLQMEQGSTLQLPTCTARAQCPAISPLTHINGAAKERAFLKCLLNDFEEVGWCLLQLIPFCNSTGEVLKAFSGGATRERLIRSIQPAQKDTHTHTTIRLPIFLFSQEKSAGSPFSSSLGERHSVCQLSQHFCFHSTTPATNVPSIQLCFLDLRTCRAQHSLR